MQINTQPRQRALEFGIYRDGDNNLDQSQEYVVRQALDTSAKDSSIEYNIEDTTALRQAQGDRVAQGVLRGRFAPPQDDKLGLETDTFTIADGGVANAKKHDAADMSSEANLARFVADTLDRAEKSGAKQTWIDLVDHGAGDGGGLEADSTHGIMSMPNIAKAIADGVKLHAQEHPEDAQRSIDGVVANQCLMATMGFADALSRAGVRFLAASPETMLSPGVPSDVAEAIASNENDPSAMAGAVVRDVMRTSYPFGSGPAAAFDVLNTSSASISNAEQAIKRFNDDAVSQAKNGGVRDALRADVRSVRGMVRFPDATPDMPWNADRPAIALYEKVASDSRLGAPLRDEARAAADAVKSLVLAHAESKHFGPFDNSSYADAAGPTIHAPINAGQIDPWAPRVSETANAFYEAADQDRFTQAIA